MGYKQLDFKKPCQIDGNENTNGLIRQYLKKGSDFNNVTDDDLIAIMDKLNTRPRKSLGYAIPNEVFNASQSN